MTWRTSERATLRELSQATTQRVTILDPSDTLGDPVVEQAVRKLIKTAGRLVANRNAPGSGLTAPYGRIDDTGRVELSRETIKKTGDDRLSHYQQTLLEPLRGK